MLDELAAFMDAHHFNTLADFKGHSLQYFTSHHDLVERQAAARKSAKAVSRTDGQPIGADREWRGDEFVRQSDALSRG
jgi:recombinational DNA repair ATPase RecF